MTTAFERLYPPELPVARPELTVEVAARDFRDQVVRRHRVNAAADAWTRLFRSLQAAEPVVGMAEQMVEAGKGRGDLASQMMLQTVRTTATPGDKCTAVRVVAMGIVEHDVVTNRLQADRYYQSICQLFEQDCNAFPEFYTDLVGKLLGHIGLELRQGPKLTMAELLLKEDAGELAPGLEPVPRRHKIPDLAELRLFTD